jgi:autotransporter passenger strand-loop-strand repeat protein
LYAARRRRVFGGAQTSGTSFNAGGILEFGSGYTGVGNVVSNGLTLEVAAGGIASGTTVNSGGLEEVLSGGTASATTINGGTLEVASGASISGPITFTSAGGILELDASQSFNGLIAGFASPKGIIEEIDLRDISFGKKTKVSFKEDKNHLSGTLTVTDGTHTANLTLLGQYSAGNFRLSSDGFGGTMIIDPAVGSGGHPVVAPPA